MKRRNLPRNVERHGPGYRASVMRDGIRYRSPVYDTVAEAERAAMELRSGTVPDRLATLEDVIDLHRDALKARGATPATLVYAKHQWGILRDAFGSTTPMHLIDAQAVRLFLRTRLREVSASTVAKHYSVLRRLFNLALREGLVDHSPMSQVDPPKPRTNRYGHLTPDEIRAVVQKAPKVADLVLTLFYTAMRRSELASITAADVDLKMSVIRLRQGKEDARLVRIAKALRPILERLMEEKPRGSLFGSANNITNRLRYWSDVLGEPRLHAHALRVSCVTAMLDAGVGVERVKSHVGHKTLHMTMHYYRESAKEAQRAADAVDLGLPGDGA